LNSTYKSAGVNLEAGNETVNRVKLLVKSTFTKNVLTGIGHFGAFYQLDLKDYKNPVLVSSVDGVGTKLKIAIEMNRHKTVGQDLVNHCVNDISVCGAKPLYFMDYLAFGKLNPDLAEEIVEGFAISCKENNVSLIGGETAEMPGMYLEKDYDMSGTIVGIVEKDKILDGGKVKKENLLIGFKSNGLHTNGYSLARKVLLKKYNLDDRLNEIGNSLGDELLKIHKSYLNIIQTLLSKNLVNAFSHITGGGILGNTKRVVPQPLKIEINWDAWKRPVIFDIIQKTGNIEEPEMQNVFNLGIGLVAIIDKKNLNEVISLSESVGEKAIPIVKIL